MDRESATIGAQLKKGSTQPKASVKRKELLKAPVLFRVQDWDEGCTVAQTFFTAKMSPVKFVWLIGAQQGSL